MTAQETPHALARYEYTHSERFAEVQRLAAEGWRLVGLAAVSRAPGQAETLYVLERPAGGAA
jgi:hypothetical protein